MANLGVVTSQFTDPFLRGTLLKAFTVKLESSKPVWKAAYDFDEMTSQKAFEEIAETAGLGLAPRKEELAAIAVDVVKQGYTTRINQYAYAIQVQVSEEARRFKQYREAVDASGSVVESLVQTQEYVASDVFGNAFSSTIGLMPDGQPLCSTSHKLARGGTFSNSIGAVSISETGIESMMILCKKMPGSNGLPVGVNLKRVLVPVDRYFDAKRILKSQQQNNTANNAINALYDENIDIKASRYLPSTTNWWGVTDADNGVLWVWTQKPEYRDYGIDNTRAHVSDGYEMFGVNAVNPRKYIGSSF